MHSGFSSHWYGKHKRGVKEADDHYKDGSRKKCKDDICVGKQGININVIIQGWLDKF
jgi:hypothetical protein